MLPITRHRTLAIPHRLALVAAAVCLVLAFTVDQSTLDEQLQARQVDRAQDEPQEEATLEAVTPKEQVSAGKSGRSGRLELSPWFSGLTH